MCVVLSEGIRVAKDIGLKVQVPLVRDVPEGDYVRPPVVRDLSLFQQRLLISRALS